MQEPLQAALAQGQPSGDKVLVAAWGVASRWGRPVERHRAQIREVFGFREFTRPMRRRSPTGLPVKYDRLS